MKRKIACIAAVLCLLLSVAYLPLNALAEKENDGMTTTESSSSEGPTTVPDEPLTPVDVAFTMTVKGDRATVSVTTSDGSIPIGMPVVLVVDGVTAAEGYITSSGICQLPYNIQKGDRTYRVYCEAYTFEGKRYGASMAEKAVDYDDYYLSTDFFKVEDFDYDARTGAFSLAWNYYSFGNVHNADVTAVLVNGDEVPFTGFHGTVQADLSGRPNGTYPLDLVLSAGELSVKVSMGEVGLSVDFKPLLTATPSADGKTATVTVTDPWGTPLSGIPVTMRVGGTTYLPERTDSRGKATFSLPGGNAKVTFTTGEVQRDGYAVLQNAVLLGEFSEVTVPPLSTTDPSASQTVTTTKTTYRTQKTSERTTGTVTEATGKETTVTAAPTTGVATDGMIGVGVTYEQVLESLLGVSAAGMAEYGRLFMQPDVYDLYVSDVKSSLSLFLETRDFSVSETAVKQALAAGGVTGYSAADAYRVAVRLSLLLRTDDEYTTMPVLEGEYIVQLPIPEGLATADACAVAYYDENGNIQKAVMVAPEDGFIRFPASHFGTFVFIGLYPGTQNSLFWPILFIVLGSLLVLCGAVLVWLRVAGAEVLARAVAGKGAAEGSTDESALQVPAAPLTEHAAPVSPREADEVIARAAAPVENEPVGEYEDIFSSAARRDAFNSNNGNDNE